MRFAFQLLSAWALATGAIAADGPNRFVFEPGQPFSTKEIAEICKNTELRVLDLRRAGLNDKVMPLFAKLSDLEELRIDSHQLTGEGYAVLGDLKALKRLTVKNLSSPAEAEALFDAIKDHRLTELDISGSSQFTGLGLERLGCKKTLEILDLSCSRGALTDKGLESIRGFTELKSLDLNGHAGIKKGVRFLEGMTKLEHLNLYGCVGMEDPDLTSLFAKLTNLKTLNMGFCWAHTGKGLVYPTSLTRLELIESKSLTDAALANFPPKDNLEHLNLFQCLPLTDKGISALADMPNLRFLNIGCIRALTNQSLKSISGNTGLTHLNISDNDHFDDAGLSQLKGMRDLEVLNLWHIKGITGSGFGHLAGLTRLKELNLADCHNLEDGGFSQIGGWASLENLHLDNCNKVTDAAIAKLAGCENLKELTVSGCKLLTDRSLDQIKSMRSLTYLDIRGCEGMTDAGRRMIRRMLPGCVVVR